MYEISPADTNPKRKEWMDGTIFEELLRELDCISSKDKDEKLS